MISILNSVYSDIRCLRVGHGLDSSTDWIGLGWIGLGRILRNILWIGLDWVTYSRYFDVSLIVIASPLASVSRLSDFHSTLSCMTNWLQLLLLKSLSTSLIACISSKMLNRFLYTSEIVFAAGGSMEWIGCGSEHGRISWIGLSQ